MFLWNKKLIKFGICLLGISSLINPLVTQAQEFVDKELILEIDISDSIDSTEYDDIITGYSNAFRDSVIQERVDGLSDGIAVAVQFFSSGQTQLVSNADEYFSDSAYDPSALGNTALSGYFATNTQWFVLDTANDAEEFALFLDNLIGVRPDSGASAFSSNSAGCDTDTFFVDAGDGIGTGTNIGGAIQQGTCEINRTAQRFSRPNGTALNTGFDVDAGTNKIIASYEQAIDISSDGVQNTTLAGTQIGTGTNAVCNLTQADQIACQAALQTGQNQSANLGLGAGDTGGIDTGGDFTWDSPITRINGLPVNNDVALESIYFSTGFDQANNDGDPDTFIGPVVGGVNQGATDAINDNTFDTGVGVNGSFVVSADEYADFEPAIVLKLQNELEAVPFEFKPGFGLLLGLGIFGLRQWQQKGQKGQKEKVQSSKKADLKKELSTVS